MITAIGEQVALRTSSLSGIGTDPENEVLDMFRRAATMLAREGMSFGDVVRTWIHVRDITAHYDALNRGRRRFFAEAGVDQRPASTGVQGEPLAGNHRFSMALLAVAPSDRFPRKGVSCPSLNEAWTYGADFARALKVREANRQAVYVSGTASIDEHGSSVHPESLEAQATRMFQNINGILESAGASSQETFSGTIYLRNPDSAPKMRRLLQDNGFGEVPCSIVHAPLCRPELLCEAEMFAALPPPIESR